jgi:hypothetical protein
MNQTQDAAAVAFSPRKTIFTMSKKSLIWATASGVMAIVFIIISNGCGMGNADAAAVVVQKDTTEKGVDSGKVATASLALDTALHNAKLQWITNGDSSGKWPVKAPLPLPGAILPFKRVLAYYGNLYSTKMGVLGEYPEKEMLDKLQAEIKRWQKADTTMEVVPALHYIAVTAQGSPGAGGKYRLRMPFKEIDKVLAMAAKINALVFIDIQVGLGSVQEEVPQLEQYLKMPNVHFGVDPEFSMKTGAKPGSVIGTFDAADINFVTNYLAKLVKDNNLPPKMLVIHRFTQGMVTNYKNIKLVPEVQMVMDMDGWGMAARKINTYKQFIYKEPVQYTGFKLFYKNDFREPGSRIMTPEEVLKLKPQPVYIQYQ